MSEIRSRAGIPSIESMLLHRQLCWQSHVVRMPGSRMPHCVLYGQPRQGHRSVGGQKKRLKDHKKFIHKKCNIHLTGWRFLHPTDLPVPMECAMESCFDAEYDPAASLRRSCRHQHAAAPRPLPGSAHVCPPCDRQCYSRIYLLRHSKTVIQR